MKHQYGTIIATGQRVKIIKINRKGIYAEITLNWMPKITKALRVMKPHEIKIDDN